MTRKTQDPVNQPNIEFSEKRGYIPLGLLKSREWIEDPRRMLFSMSRYKFVSKLLSGRKHALEIGCGDAFNAPIIMQEVTELTVTDFCEEFIIDARKRKTSEWPYHAILHNFLEAPLNQSFDAGYSLDVLEHIPQKDEDTFITNICQSLSDNALLIIGMPSLESQEFASTGSKLGHINCKTSPDFKILMEEYFNTVLMFSMNDEVIHTGYHKMAHYLIAVCSHKK